MATSRQLHSHLAVDRALRNHHFRSAVYSLVAEAWKATDSQVEFMDTHDPLSDENNNECESVDERCDEDEELVIEVVYDCDSEIPRELRGVYEHILKTELVRREIALSEELRRQVGKVLSKLPPPWIVHERDIIESICRGPAAHRDGGGDLVWDGMIADVLHEAGAPGNPLCEFGNECDIEIELPVDIGIRPGVPLVHIGNGLCIEYVGGEREASVWRLALTLSGRCSRRAAQVAAERFIPPFAVLLRICIERAVLQHWNTKTDLSDGLDIDASRRGERLWRIAIGNAMRWYRLLLGREGRGMLVSPSRISTALAYLHEASKQAHDGLQLAVMFTAIEAVLGDKGEGVTEQIARRTAVLLCANSDERREAHRYVKELYGYRSTAVHGSKWESPASHIVDRVRGIAWTVILATLEWDEAMWKMGQRSAKDGRAFFDAITEADFSGKQVVGVPEDVVHMARRSLLKVNADWLMREH